MPEAPDQHTTTKDADPPLIESPAGESAAALLTALVAGGVREFVVCPGSRSQALALTAVELEALGVARVHVRTDERVAGFLALGLARESGLPAAVITTSGTAVANLLPAVLEAHHSHVPMLALTADRPAELHGTGANQTTRQAGIFGDFARLFDVAAPEGSHAPGTEACAATQRRGEQAVAAARGIHTHDPGPVQLNLAYREPLSGAVPALAPLLAAANERALKETEVPGPETPEREALTLEQNLPGVVIAGADAGERAERFARAADWPLVAEVVSGARFGPNLVHYYRELLDDENFGGRARRAVVFGHPTLSREVAAFLARDDMEVIVVAPHLGEEFNPGRGARIVSSVRVTEPWPDRSWAGRWVQVSRRVAELMAAQRAEQSADEAAPDIVGGHSPSPKKQLEFVRAEFDAVRAPITHRMLAEMVWRFTWPHDRLVYGASRLVREADRVVRGRRVAVHANRGLAGIDGTISTAWGVALASQEVEDPNDSLNELLGVTRVLLGDVAFAHDVSGLQAGHGEAAPHLQIIVGNDGGGTIFDGLEAAETAQRSAFDRVMYAPNALNIEAIAEAYGCPYSLAKTRGDLDRALSAPPEGVSVLEVALER